MRKRFKQLLAENLVVNLKDGSTLSGVLWSDRGGLLVLRNAQYHDNEADVSVDGEAIILIENIAFLQRPEVTRASN